MTQSGNPDHRTIHTVVGMYASSMCGYTVIRNAWSPTFQVCEAIPHLAQLKLISVPTYIIMQKERKERNDNECTKGASLDLVWACTCEGEFTTDY